MFRNLGDLRFEDKAKILVWLKIHIPMGLLMGI
jgi:hypothetical protein